MCPPKPLLSPSNAVADINPHGPYQYMSSILHGPSAVVDRHPDSLIENLPEHDYVLRGDYVELDDLVDPETPSSSGNSSCLSLTSEEYLDSLSLCDLEDENCCDLQRKNSNFKFSVSGSARTNQVVMHPDTSGSVVKDNGCKVLADATPPDSSLVRRFPDKKVVEYTTSRQKMDYKNEGTSDLCNVGSCSGHKRPAEEMKITVGRMRKLHKKYFCFMAF